MPTTRLDPTPSRRPMRLGARRELTLMIAFCLLTMVVIGFGAALVTRSVAERQSREEAERTTQRLADLVVAPLVPADIDRQPADVSELDRVIGLRKADGTLTKVTVWTVEGEVLYSDDPAQIGRLVVPPPAEVVLAAGGVVSSGFESSEPEAARPLSSPGPSTPSPQAVDLPQPTVKRYVEVYVPMAVSGRTMVFEAYYDYAQVDRVAHRLLRRTLPVVWGPLVLLQLVQIPAGISLARRLRHQESERARLLEQSLTVSERERARIAADLHDGPIQELAGISYAMGAVATGVGQRQSALMSRVEQALQRAIKGLRGLMTDLYSPGLRGMNLERSVLEFSEPLQATGVDVRVELVDHAGAGEETLVTLYRVARESLLNVQKHARATSVVVTLEQTGHSGADQLRLTVVDDGVGTEPDRLDRRAEGHLGLRLVADRVESLGGRLTITSAPGEGTRVEAVLPLHPG